VPSDVEPSKALDNNDRFRVVWTVLNALRAHDDRFNATINKIELNKKRPSSILIGGASHGQDYGDGTDNPQTTKDVAEQIALQFEELQGVMYAKMVQKVGDRVYWEKWAKDVAIIAENQIERINNLIELDQEHKSAFDSFLKGLQQNINPSITQSQAVEMLSQHIITKPVFEALFEGYSFVKNNAISKSMQSMLDVLEEHIIEKDTQVLDKFYQSVKKRASGIDNAEGKQRIIVELYDKFFYNAFPKMVQQLGIVYTPVEVVDFIIHSVNDVLKKEFARSVSDENVHILDPFTGTGTFITRLLQSGLIAEKDLYRKYTKELHANEIVLLAYYIAAVNIENAFHDATEDPDDGIGKEKFIPFDGIVLTDTFQTSEIEDSVLISEMFPENSKRLEAQKKGPIRVIMGNPPYSVGQKSENDNAQNQEYTKLNSRIENTYGQASNATSVKALYDAYIKAFRWSTDRLDPKNGGVIAFVSNGAWIETTGMDGFRKELENEFSAIYVFNLRGNQRTSGELSRKEGGKIFGSGSRTPISITLLIKKPEHKGKATIYYHDIGDYLSQQEKLKIIADFKSINRLPIKILKPNKEGDWINKRNDVFNTFINVEPDKKFNQKSHSYFVLNSLGLNSNRDPWVYNSNKNKILNDIGRMVENFNVQVENFKELSKYKKIDLKEFIDKNPKNISWSSSLIPHVERGNKAIVEKDKIITALYRPFFKQKLYLGDKMIHRRGQIEQLFPLNTLHKNLTITVSGVGSSKGFSPIISDCAPDIQLQMNAQSLPLYYYQKREKVQGNLFDANSENKFIKRDGVSDFILQRAIKQYGKAVTKEAIFYYVYGILHSPEYRITFANDLKKMLPRIPLVDEPRDFWKFSKAGKALADLHINYENIEPAKGVIVMYGKIPKDSIQEAMDSNNLEAINYKVSKMKFPKKDQKETIIYNSQITINNIPEKAYEYVVNGKSAIDWIIERYQVSTDKKSGITNNPNDWADEVGNPRYILDLLLSVINVSVQTVDIVSELPKLEFE
tara:strand:- start:1081 stop:4131 length:3051 start_codon:yes stop_codon:yes gene_type:complete